MRVIKYPNFNKEHSKAIIFDGRRPYIVNVEITSKDNPEIEHFSAIQLTTNTPDIRLDFLHEIHHLYRPLLEPIWTPTLPTLKDECILAKIYEDEKFREDIIKALKLLIKPKRDEKSRKTTIVMKASINVIFELGRFDNVFEDIKIHDHLVKRHRISKDRLNAIESDVLHIYDAIQLGIEKLRPYYKDIFTLLDKYVKLTRMLADMSKIPYGFYYYLIFDVIFCKYDDCNLPKYYDECIKALKDAKERFKSSTARGIFKHALIKRVDLELQRVRFMREALEIPEVRHFFAYVLAGELKIDEIEQILNVKVLKGYRDPLTIFSNGHVVTWYKTYKINGIKTDNNVAKDVSHLFSILRRMLVRFRTPKNLHKVIE